MALGIARPSGDTPPAPIIHVPAEIVMTSCLLAA